MTEQEYIQQNALGFEGDNFLADKFQDIITTHKIKTVIETGTYRGGTTKRLATMAKKVLTIESNLDNYRIAQKTLEDCTNVTMIAGSSAELLPFAIARLEGKVFFFLDAHWGDNNPLLAELAIIKELGLKPIIAIHDFKVPEHPELGYDTYPAGSRNPTIVYEWDYIKEAIEGIYGKTGYLKEYNSHAAGAKRGVIFIFPFSSNVK